MATTQPIRNKQQVRALAEYYLRKGQLRNHILILLGLHTALRVSDLLRLTWDDVYDFENNRIRPRIDIVEKKTRKSKSLSLNRVAISALLVFANQAAQKGRILIENNKTKKSHQPYSSI